MKVIETDLGLKILVNNEEEYQEMRNLDRETTKKLHYSIMDVIRVYKVKDLTEEEAFKLWYEKDKITCGELQFVKENNKKGE